MLNQAVSSSPPQEVTGLCKLLERIAKSEGPVNPNDKAVARIYAGYMRERGPVLSSPGLRQRNRRLTD
jgi:hypothetical protein